MKHIPLTMSPLLECRVECFEIDSAIKERVEDLEDFLPDTRPLEINRLVVLNCEFVC